MTGCFGCRFATQAKKNRDGVEQVKCEMAEKMFEYKGWVDAKEESTCGVYEPFKGSPVDEQKKLPAPAKKKKQCSSCAGNGVVLVMIGETRQSMKCRICNGAGTLTIEEEFGDV